MGVDFSGQSILVSTDFLEAKRSLEKGTHITHMKKFHECIMRQDGPASAIRPASSRNTCALSSNSL